MDAERDQIAAEPRHNPVSGVTARNLVYIIYTSGSTGKPKGTLIEHGGLRNVTEAQWALFGLHEQDRILQFASLSFDASIFEIATAIRAGGTVCMASSASLLPGPNLGQTLRQAEITVVTLPPSALAAMDEGEYPHLRIIAVAGEACPAEAVERWAPGRRFFNLYGPTEATIWATAAECFAGNGKPSIGRPIPNVQTYILDSRRQPTPVGVAGELYIGGAGVARGYLNRPDLSGERFVGDPFAASAGARMYRTGDVARWLADGTIEFLGRADHQVKIRGFRIEPGEIEDVLREHPGVRESAVVARQDHAGDQRLIAYYVPDGSAEVDAADLREHAKTKLPAYMVPAAFISLSALPLTPNGKLDRHALPDPDQFPSGTRSRYAPPQNELERSLAEIWQTILHVEQIGTEDNFFDLGGHSLLVVKVHNAIRTGFGVDISMVDLFRYPTIRSLADHLSNGASELGYPGLQNAQDRGLIRREAMARQKQLRDVPVESEIVIFYNRQ